MVYERNSQLAKPMIWRQRERWHHLPYMMYIATLQGRHIYWRQKVGHAQNI